MAELCAFLFPGLGHLILGKPGQALLWCIGIFIGYFMLILPGVFLHIGSIVHAATLERKQIAACRRMPLETQEINRRRRH